MLPSGRAHWSVYFTLFVQLSCCLFSASSSLMPAPLKALSPRLSRLVTLVPESCTSVADVGCDHAQLAGRLALRESMQRVYACDVSAAAAKGAATHIQNLPPVQKDKVSLLLGDGLAPLVAAGAQADTVVLSGMGVRSVFEILACAHAANGAPTVKRKQAKVKSQRGAWGYDYWTAYTPASMTNALGAVGVRRLVLAPWPPNFLPYQGLLHLLLRSGWHFEQQSVDKERGYHYITSVLCRSEPEQGRELEDGNTKGHENENGTLSLQHNPLYLSCADADAAAAAAAAATTTTATTGTATTTASTTGFGHDESDVLLWQDYLRAQLPSLHKRQLGRRLRDEQQPLMDAAGGAAAAPVFDLDAVVTAVESQLK